MSIRTLIDVPTVECIEIFKIEIKLKIIQNFFVHVVGTVYNVSPKFYGIAGTVHVIQKVCTHCVGK